MVTKSDLTSQLAKHLRDVHFGGNWTVSNLKEHVAGLSWQQATTQVHSFNTIVTLVYHTGYYIEVLMDVLNSKPLNAKDEYSFNHPPVNSQEDWEKLLDKTWTNAETAARMIEQLPESKLEEIFINTKYGTYFRNISGIIEHLHYHLGQIVLIKKLVLEKNESKS